MDSGGSPVSPVSPDSVGPRCALKIVALWAKIGSVVPTALYLLLRWRAKMSLCMESVESLTQLTQFLRQLRTKEGFSFDCSF